MHPRSGRRKLSQTIKQWALSMTCGAKAATLDSARELQLPVDLVGDPQEDVANAPEMPAEMKGLPQAEEQNLIGIVCDIPSTAIQDPMDLLQLDDTLEAVPEELKQELQGVFSCAICFDEHSLEDCYIARVCGHRMCRDAAREVVLGAVRSALGSDSSAELPVTDELPGCWATRSRHLPRMSTWALICLMSF